MRQFRLMFILLLTIVLAVSCKSVSYVPRSIDIAREDAKQNALNAELKVDLNQKVSGTSDMQDSKKSAIISAYHNCITTNNIDVVVDPIVKLTKYSVFSSRSVKNNAENAKWWVTQFKAEIIGYSGKYVKIESDNDEVKKFDNIDMNSVIKYKLITDPEFHKSYYNNQKSNNVIFNSNSNSSKKAVNNAPQTGQLKPLMPLSVKPISYSDMMKQGKVTRNVGIAFSVIGVALLAPIGATLYCYKETRSNYDYYSGYYSYTRRPYELAGLCCMGIGGGLTAIGIGCIGGGVAKINKAKRNMSFAYNISPTSAQLALNF